MAEQETTNLVETNQDDENKEVENKDVQRKKEDAPTILVLYHSVWGHVRTMADKIAEGVLASGCNVEVWQAPETLSDEAIQKVTF